MNLNPILLNVLKASAMKQSYHMAFHFFFINVPSCFMALSKPTAVISLLLFVGQKGA